MLLVNMVLPKFTNRFCLCIFSWTLVAVIWHSALSQDPIFFDSFTSTENKALKDFVFKVINDVHSYFQCYTECNGHEECSSVNFYPSDGVCELNYASHVSHPNKMNDEVEATYLFNLDQKQEVIKTGRWAGIGGSNVSPVKDCKELNQSYPKLPFLGYCDMETDGGGWTLVWSFNFNTYSTFKHYNNYIKPTPKNFVNGPVISDTPPQNETDMNAIDFDFWKTIGSEFLIKSNINNWVACLPKSGNLVTKTEGTLDCRFIKQIVTDKPECKEVPGEFKGKNHGQALLGNTTGKPMYYFEKSDSRWPHWPVHDPCGLSEPNHKKDVVNPHTNVYIR